MAGINKMCMKVKIKSEIFGGWPVWGIYDEKDERIDMYDRATDDKKGLVKEQLLEILKHRGFKF